MCMRTTWILHSSVTKNFPTQSAFRQRHTSPTRYLLLVAKQQKAKSGQIRNDARANGKANKTKPGQRRTRALEKPSPVELVLMGKGLYTSWAKKAATDKPRGVPRRVKDSDD